MTKPPATELSLPRAIRQLIRNHPGLFSAFAFGWLIFHLWPLLPGLLSKALFDTLRSGDVAGLNLPTLLGLVVAAGLARITAMLGAAYAGSCADFENRSVLYVNIMSVIFTRPGAAAHQANTGEAISTLRDDTSAISRLDDWASDVNAAVIFGGAAIVIMLLVDVRTTLLVLPPVVLICVVAYLARNWARRLREESRAATARVTGIIGEIVLNAEAIRSAGKEDAVVRRLRDLGTKRKQAMARDRVHGLALDGVFDTIAGLGAGITLVVAAEQLRSGEFTVGDFVLFATYLMYVAGYTGFVGHLIHSYQQAAPALRRIGALLQEPPPRALLSITESAPTSTIDHSESGATGRTGEPGAGFERLQAVGITYRFDGGGGVRDVSLTIERGEFLVITGRVGAGKTTLIRAMLGLLPRQNGQIRWNGRLVERPQDFLVPPRVGYTSQRPVLLSGTLRENLLLGAEDDHLEEAIRIACLERDLGELPAGLDTQIGVGGVRLSGGQVQRAATARMLVRRPDVVVVDDLSSSLDTDTEQEVWNRLSAAGRTVVAVAGRPEVLRRADQVIVLDEGDHGGW